MVKLLKKEVGNIGFGLMGLTWRPTVTPNEQAFAAMRTALTKGAKFWNGGEFYGTVERNSLQLLNEYFTKYPEDADKVVLSIKGGATHGTPIPDGSKENVRRSIDECLKLLDGKKFLDIFECARQDPKVAIEDTIATIAEYVKAGKIGGIGLSEVNAETVRRAHAVHPIVAVEIEFSMYATQIFDNGLAATCAELEIPIVGYSPLGRGFLTGQYKKYEDIPKDSYLQHWPRFQPDVFDHNVQLADEVRKIAAQKGVTAPQVALGWALDHSKKDGGPEIIALPGATTSERVEENMAPAALDEKDMAVIDDILKKIEVKGARYPPGAEGQDD